MSEIVILAIRDLKADAFLPPIFVRNLAVGVRMLEQALRDPASDFAKFPEDYFLYELGAWDDATGAFSLLPAPRQVCSAVSLLKVRTDA